MHYGPSPRNTVCPRRAGTGLGAPLRPSPPVPCLEWDRYLGSVTSVGASAPAAVLRGTRRDRPGLMERNRPHRDLRGFGSAQGTKLHLPVSRDRTPVGSSSLPSPPWRRQNQGVRMETPPLHLPEEGRKPSPSWFPERCCPGTAGQAPPTHFPGGDAVSRPGVSLGTRSSRGPGAFPGVYSASSPELPRAFITHGPTRPQMCLTLPRGGPQHV